MRGPADMVVTPADLAAADIVLTNFDVLRKDVNFESNTSGESMAARSSRWSKYPVFPTPLTRLTWWRVIVDEAQMIEGASSKAAVMANQLRMVNRWCVTGTPISKGLEDIFGLVLFLQARTNLLSLRCVASSCLILRQRASACACRKHDCTGDGCMLVPTCACVAELSLAPAFFMVKHVTPTVCRALQVQPWCDRATWAAALARPLQAGCPAARRALLALLQPARGGLMRRTAKNDVAAELGIPAQTSHVKKLDLSAVERHAYRRCHRETADKARGVLPDMVVAAAKAGTAVPEDLDRPLTAKEGDALTAALVRLRQARSTAAVARGMNGSAARAGLALQLF